MELLNIVAMLISASAIFSYINYKTIKLPNSIGVLIISLLFSLFLIIANQLGLGMVADAQSLISHIDFNTTLMQGMLSFLLFAGALHVNINDLAKKKWVIAVLASAGILLSTFIIGVVTDWVLGRIGLEIPFIYCLLFGALISPTDPIAVLGILKTANAPKSLEIKITGESLFNDGIGVVIFLVLLGIAVGTEPVTFSNVASLFLLEAVGGVVFGLVIGYVAYFMLKSVNHYQIEIMITLAVVSGGYAIAHMIHVSGPIAIVAAGLLIGNQGRYLAMSEKTREHLDSFWELLDELLNAILFILIGLEILALSLSVQLLIAGLFIIPVVLAARFISVGIPIKLFSYRVAFSDDVVKIMTWGGLRGGISIALALSLPDVPARDIILTITYIVVIFSILVQGLTLKYVLSDPKKEKQIE